MTRLTYPQKEEIGSTLPRAYEGEGNEAGQILHLKRLLVTVKQHYEKSLHQLQIQYQAEQDQRLAARKELERVQTQLTESQQQHDEELQALRKQQTLLKELLKKAQDEAMQLKSNAQGLPPSADGKGSGQEFVSVHEEVERMHLEAEALRSELSQQQKRNKELDQMLVLREQESQKEIELLRQLLEDQKLQGSDMETVVSTTSSHHLRRELEMIKSMLVEGAKESKALEARFAEVLNEKIEIGQQCRQLQHQLENQSANLLAFQEKMHDLEEKKRNVELALQSKEAEWIESCHQRQELQSRLDQWAAVAKEKDHIQDKYEQLKEEWKHLAERLEEANETRIQLDAYLSELEATAAQQNSRLHELLEELQAIQHDKGSLESERDQLKVLLEESEARLKVAQQHLAKKVKEATIMGEKLEEQQAILSEYIREIEEQKVLMAQLQASVDLYQRQENRLQDQLHETLKGTESQIAKWEEKYFRMYEKWQESENRARELKKFEEKHMQMQSLLANLGSFMGGSYNHSAPAYSAGQEMEEAPVRPYPFDHGATGEAWPERSSQEVLEERYNLFGMRQPPPQD